MELVEFGALGDEQRAQLEGDEADPWEAGRLGIELLWRQKERFIGLRDTGGRLVAAAGLLLVEIQAGDSAAIPVVGLGGVIVARASRRRGLGSRVISAALELAQTLGPDLAMLFCHRDRAPIYAGYGFTEVTGPVTVEQPTGPVVMPMVTMWRGLRGRTDLPEGPVSLHGPPF